MKKSVIVSIIILLLMSIAIAIFTYNTVWLGDDINYAYDFRYGHREETITSFPQIISSMSAHYLSTNGRYIPHILVQAFCGIWGRMAFTIANALMYVVFMLLLCRLCSVKLDNYKGVLSVVLLSLVTFQTKMTPSCQIGYIWTFSIVMAFLLLFFSKRNYSKWWQLLCLGLFSLLAGNGNEALTLGVSGALVMYFITNFKRMSKQQLIMTICFGIGTLVICLSPAAYSRAAESVDGSVVWVCKSAYTFFTTLKASFVMIAIVAWKVFHSKQSLKHIYKNNSFFFNVWIVMIAFNTLIGFGSNRQVFGAELAAIIIAIRLLKDHAFMRLWLGVFAVCLIYLWTVQYEFVIRVKHYYDEITRQYEESSDGVVYLDINQDEIIPYSMDFSPKLPLFGVEDIGLYQYDNLAKILRTTFPGKDNVIILPAFLRGCKDRQLDNAIYSLEQNGLFLVIQSVQNPKQLYIVRKIDVPFLSREYEPMLIDTDDVTVYSTPYWKACYISFQDYSIQGLSHNELFFK